MAVDKLRCLQPFIKLTVAALPALIDSNCRINLMSILLSALLHFNEWSCSSSIRCYTSFGSWHPFLTLNFKQRERFKFFNQCYSKFKLGFCYNCQKSLLNLFNQAVLPFGFVHCGAGFPRCLWVALVWFADCSLL